MPLDPSLAENYRRTTYRVTEVQPAIDIRVGALCPVLDALLEKHAASCWAFITACNPGSNRLDPAANRRRQAVLFAEVRELGYVTYRGAGVPDAENWEEEASILIVGIDRGTAVKLGAEFEQAAIVFGARNGKAELVFIGG